MQTFIVVTNECYEYIPTCSLPKLVETAVDRVGALQSLLPVDTHPPIGIYEVFELSAGELWNCLKNVVGTLGRTCERFQEGTFQGIVDATGAPLPKIEEKAGKKGSTPETVANEEVEKNMVKHSN